MLGLFCNHPDGADPVARGGRYHAEMEREDCAFCAIVSGAGPAHVMLEDERAMAFLDRNPATRGHTLVVPKVHARNLWTIDEPAFAAVATMVRAVAHLLRERLRPDGVTLFQANERAGWQDVFHLHVHVVPRYRGDGLVRPWQMAYDGGRDDLAAVAGVLAGRSDGPAH